MRKAFKPSRLSDVLFLHKRNRKLLTQHIFNNDSLVAEQAGASAQAVIEDGRLVCYRNQNLV